MKLINIRKIKIKLFIIFILFFNLSININTYAQDCGGFSCEEFSLQNLYDNALGLPNFALTNNTIPPNPPEPPEPPEPVACQCTPVTVEQSCYCVYREFDNPEPIPEPEPEPVDVTEPTPSETGEGWARPAACACTPEELSTAPQCRLDCADIVSQEYVDSIPFCTSSDEHLAINPNDGTYYCTSE